MQIANIEGVLFDGLSSKGKSAVLEVASLQSLVLTVGTQKYHLSSDHLTFSSRLGNSARTISIQNHGKFETKDNSGVDLVASSLGMNSRLSLLHRLESNLGMIFIATIITVALGWAIVKYGIPVAADFIVDNLPDKTADYLEDKILEQLEARWFSASKLEQTRQDELHALFKQVVQELGAQEKGYQFRLRDAKDGVGANALAFPSGTIVMTDQLVNLVNNDAQIAGVLAHEIGHLQGKHSLRQIVRGSILTFMVAFIAGDVSGASAVLVAAPTVLIELRYSREFESEADTYALKYIGCDKTKLQQMARFFELLDAPVANNMTVKNHTLKRNKSSNSTATEDDVTIDNQPEETTDDVQGSEEQSIDFPKVNLEFLLTHPKSKKRSAHFRNYFDRECGAVYKGY